MDLEKITRDIFRIPVLESHDVTARIDGNTYTVANLGSKGLGILLSETGSFPVNNDRHKITLQLLDKTFELTGRVVHISPHESDNFLCGIELLDMDEESKQAFHEYIKANRASMFAGQQ